MTSTSSLCYATATELARRIREREISSAEVTDAFLALIAALQIHSDTTRPRSLNGNTAALIFVLPQ